MSNKTLLTQLQRPDGHFYAVYHPVCIKVKGLLNLTSLCSGMLQLGLLDPPTSGGDLEEVIHEIYDSICIEESTGKIHTMFSVKILYFSCFYVKWLCRPEFWLMKSILGVGSVETSTGLFQRSHASPNMWVYWGHYPAVLPYLGHYCGEDSVHPDVLISHYNQPTWISKNDQILLWFKSA